MPEIKTSPDDLNEIMEIDRVIHVDASGVVTVKDGGFYAPELAAVTDEYGQCTADHDQSMRDQAHDAGWELLSGWSGQYGYHGPEMDPSERIRGRLAQHILATPGFWVAVAVGYPDDSGHGWCLAWREDVHINPVTATVRDRNGMILSEDDFATLKEAWLWLADQRDAEIPDDLPEDVYLEDIWHNLVAQAYDTAPGPGEVVGEDDTRFIVTVPQEMLERVTLESPVEPAPPVDEYDPYPAHHAHPSGVTELSENEAVELALSVGNRQGELFQFASGHRFDPIIAMAEARFNGPQDQTTSSLLLFLARYLVADITGVPWARRSDDLDAVNWLRASTEDRTN